MPDLAAGRVLHHVALVTTPRAIAPPLPMDDPAVRALVEHSVAQAHARGLDEGREQGRAEAEASAVALASEIERGLRIAVQASSGLADELAGRLATLAVDIAATVVPGLDLRANGVIERLEQALRIIDDRPLRIHAHPGEVSALAAVCPPEVEVSADAGLAPGEVRIGGRWADADLTWSAIWTSVRELLDAE